MATDNMGDVDEIDRILLRILSKNPRMPYTTIAEELENEGYQMSGEGIRYRVTKLLESTSAFFLLAPENHDWEIVRVGVEVVDEPNAKAEVCEWLTESGFWLVCRGFGDIDIYAIATVVSVPGIDDVLSSVKTNDLVEDVHFSIETERFTQLDHYFSHPDS